MPPTMLFFSKCEKMNEKRTNSNGEAENVSTFHAQRGHVPGDGIVQLLAFTLGLLKNQINIATLH